MKIAINQLTDLALLDKNTITATIQGTATQIKFARVAHDWNVYLEVSVDGHQWHNNVASSEDIKAFEELRREAFIAQDKPRMAARNLAFRAINNVVGF